MSILNLVSFVHATKVLTSTPRGADSGAITEHKTLRDNRLTIGVEPVQANSAVKI